MLNDLLSQDQVSAQFRVHVRHSFPNLKAAAKHYQCSIAFVSAVQTGRRHPSPAMLKDLGLRKVSGYVSDNA